MFSGHYPSYFPWFHAQAHTNLILTGPIVEPPERLEVLWSDDEGEKTKYEANTYIVQVRGNQSGQSGALSLVEPYHADTKQTALREHYHYYSNVS